MLNDTAGDHVYVLAPVTESVVEDPEQTELVPETSKVGKGLTVTVMVCGMPKQPAVEVGVTV